MTPYFIMHLNRRVASVRADGTCTVYYPSFMPYNLYLEQGDDMDTRLNNISNFEHWCASRVLTLDRAYAKEILNALGKKQAVTDRDRRADRHRLSRAGAHRRLLGQGAQRKADV